MRQSDSRVRRVEMELMRVSIDRPDKLIVPHVTSNFQTTKNRLQKAASEINETQTTATSVIG
jgi:hypothetical protein